LQTREDERRPVSREGLTAGIEKFCFSGANRFGRGDEPAWETPLIGFARGEDPLFDEIRQQIGDFYWTPQQAFALAFPGEKHERLTVISWILPQTETTKRDNRRQTEFPGERWARSRKFGEEFNDALHHHLVEILRAAGVFAVSPAHLPDFGMQVSDRFGLCTQWSHRHAAYAAGLGTFGLCDGLITPKGKAVRCGSVVAAVALEPNPRPYSDPHAYCPYFTDGSCGFCIQRCPAGAITKKGHDKALCLEYLQKRVAGYAKNHFGFESHGCGLCQTGVPCESGIPEKQAFFDRIKDDRCERK